MKRHYVWYHRSGRLLARWRRERHWNQQEGADAYGVSLSVLRAYEQGHRFPPTPVMFRICAVLNLPVIDLLEAAEKDIANT